MNRPISTSDACAKINALLIELEGDNERGVLIIKGTLNTMLGLLASKDLNAEKEWLQLLKAFANKQIAVQKQLMFKDRN